MNFGTVPADRYADASSHVMLNCYNAARPGYVRYCVYVAEGGPIKGVAPRWLSNYNEAKMKYDIYADPARSSLVGLPPSEGGGTARSYTGVMYIATPYTTVSAAVPLYGRAPGGQVLPATKPYQAQLNNSQILWAFDPDRDPGSCDMSAKTGVAKFYLGVKAFYANSCRITVATTLDFGREPTTFPELKKSSEITLQCPSGTTWLMGLNNGRNGNRRMASPGGSSIAYELYKDDARTKRWGDIESGTAVFGLGAGEAVSAPVRVYGKVPAGTLPKGKYTDTVTITLEF